MSEQPSANGSAGGPFGRFFSARQQGSRYPKAELLPRMLARLTDLILAAFLTMTAGDAGWSLAALFLLFADGIVRGQSPGKKLMGIRVVHLPSGLDADYRESALRNFPFALALLTCVIPEVGPILFLVLGLAVLLFEGYRVFSDKLGLRSGDLLAQTQVVDTKVAVGEAARPKLELVRSEPSGLNVG